MTVFKHEIKQGFKAFWIWTIAIVFMLVICVLIFPQMSSNMDGGTSEMFANMGSFSEAFGMDSINFGEIMGFYGIECGNILGIGGGFFSALIGITILSKEEKDRTAEFLLTHPISRTSILIQKLLSVLLRILVMNVIIVAASAISFAAIGENFAVKEFVLLHIAYLVMQFEIACICFGISAFVKGSSAGIGLGVATAFYFMNIIANISDKAEFLHYLTPFSYAQASDIISTSEIDLKLIVLGAVYTIVGVAVGFIKYAKKDIAS